MKRNFKLMILALSLFIVFSVVVLSVSGNEVDDPGVMASGTTGKLIWELTDDGVLTISGEGNMPNYPRPYQPWFMYNSGVTSVVIENGVTSVGEYAFNSCVNLTEVTLSESVTCIGKEAFVNCISLTDISFPTSLTSIGVGAFTACIKLDGVNIPENLTSIGYGAFDYCQSLTCISVDKNNRVYSSDGGVLFSKDGKRLVCYPMGKNSESYIVPEGVDTISEGAFRYCFGLKNIVLLSSVTSIGEAAFSNCTSLTDIIIPDGVCSVDDYAFEWCTSLICITLPKNVKSIGDFAFDNCSSLETVYYKGVEESWDEIQIGSYNNKLTAAALVLIHQDGTVHNLTVHQAKAPTCTEYGWNEYVTCEECEYTTYKEYAALGHSYVNNICSVCGEKKLIAVDTDGSLSWKLTFDGVLIVSGNGYMSDYAGNSRASWGKYASSIKEVVIEYGVKSIGVSAFSSYPYLTKVSIADSVESIGTGAFSYCNALTSVNIPGSVKKIGNTVFHRCTSLKNVIISEGVTTLGTYVFSYCSLLENITLPKSLKNICEGAFYGCESITSITIPESVETIDVLAFYYCTSLKSVVIPEGVTYIPQGVFSNCNSLTSITLPKSIKKIGYNVFYQCASLKIVNYCGTEEEWNNIVFYDGDDCFAGTEIVWNYEREYGFVIEEGGTRYYYADGSFATGFTVIEGKTYYFDSQGYLFEGESMELWSMTYYFNADHTTKEGLILDEEGYRFYKKGVRNYGWIDTDGDGERDSYFFTTTQLRCEVDRLLFDGISVKRFFIYDEETGHMVRANGFYTNEKGTQYFIDGLGAYGWITSDGVCITDRPGITLSNVHYFAYGDGLNFYMVEDATKTIGGVVREFDENHLVKSYTGWATNKTTGNANYYIKGVMQQGWCETPDGWVYLSRSENLANNITYGDVFYGWRKIGGKVYYFRASTSTPQYTVITDATRQLTYDGVRSTYYINQTVVIGTGADYYITNPPAGF